MTITRRDLDIARRAALAGFRASDLARLLGRPVEDAFAVLRSARAGLRYGEPAPTYRTDDEIRARQAETAGRRAA